MGSLKQYKIKNKFDRTKLRQLKHKYKKNLLSYLVKCGLFKMNTVSHSLKSTFPLFFSWQVLSSHTDHGRVSGLVPGTDQRPPSVWTPEDGVLGEQFTGWAGAERLHWKAGAAGHLIRVLLRRSVQSHQDAAQRRVRASCRRNPAGLNIPQKPLPHRTETLSCFNTENLSFVQLVRKKQTDWHHLGLWIMFSPLFDIYTKGKVSAETELI